MLIEECRESDELFVIYQPYRAGGLNFYFPATEEEGGVETYPEGIEYFVKHAVNYRVEINYDKDEWVFWGKGISASFYNDVYGSDNLCGREFYFMTREPFTRNTREIALKFDDVERCYIEYTDGHILRPTDWFLVNSETYNNRSQLPLETTPFTEYYPIARDLYNGTPSGQQVVDNPDCRYIAGNTPDVFYTSPDSLELLDTTLTERYYRFIAILDDGREQLITERISQEITTAAVDAYLDDAVEVVFTKSSNKYDFAIDEVGTYHRVWRKHINFSSLDSTLGYLSSDRGQPPPEYTYSCELNDCLDTEYKLDCSTHFCCYKPDGIPTKRIEK